MFTGWTVFEWWTVDHCICYYSINLWFISYWSQNDIRECLLSNFNQVFVLTTSNNRWITIIKWWINIISVRTLNLSCCSICVFLTTTCCFYAFTYWMLIHWYPTTCNSRIYVINKTKVYSLHETTLVGIGIIWMYHLMQTKCTAFEWHCFQM